MTCGQHEGGEAQAGEDVVDEKSVEVEEGRVVAWCAGGIGVEGQHKGKRVVLLHWFLFLLPMIFPQCAPRLLGLGVCELGVGACVGGKEEKEWGRVAWCGGKGVRRMRWKL